MNALLAVLMICAIWEYRFAPPPPTELVHVEVKHVRGGVPPERLSCPPSFACPAWE